MFIVSLPIKITVVSIVGLVLLIGSIFFPTYAQPVIKRLSVDDPAGIVLDLKRNVYVIETDNDRILKFNNNGTLISMWGSSGSGPGQFNSPIGIDEDESKQNVYVTDIGNNRVERFTSNGVFVGQWGSLGNGDGQFANPGRVAVDPSGNVFVADFGNNRVEKFDENGKFIMKWGSLGNGDGQFYNPTGMTVQFPQGHVYVADTGNSRIQEFTNDGKFINKWSINTPTGAVDNIDLDVNSNGTIYWTDRAADQVLTISSTAPRP
jgi:tripartite motif-containing protein 71